MCTFAGSATYGSAASLAVTSDDLGSGVVTGVVFVEPCDKDDMHLSYRQADDDPTQVTHVVVSNVAKRCNNAHVTIGLLDGDGNAIATIAGKLGRRRVTFALDTPVAVGRIEAATVAFAG